MSSATSNETAMSSVVADSSQQSVNQSSSTSTTTAANRRYVNQSSLYGVANHDGSHLCGEGPTFLRPLFDQVARFAYGCVMMEVWVYDNDAGRLNRSAWWVDQDFAASHDCSEHTRACKKTCCLDKLIDEECPDYVEVKPLAAGVGLAGTLWSEVEESHAALHHKNHGHEDQNKRPSLQGVLSLSRHGNRSHRSAIFDSSLNMSLNWNSRRNLNFLEEKSEEEDSDGEDRNVGKSGHRSSLMMSTKPKRGARQVDVDDLDEEEVVLSSRRIHWRNVEHLAGDPDQPYDERLHLFVQVGIGWAGAVPFHMAGHEGIVIYSTTKDAHLDRLKQPSNELYLKRSSDLLGAAFAIQGPLDIVSKHYDGGDLDQNGDSDSIDPETQREELEAQKELDELDLAEGFSNQAKSYVSKMLHKYQGAAVKAPPSMIWEEALLTTVAVFFTILMIASLSQNLPEQGLIMGSFGAFATLLFGLTAAPASQPRNAFWGQVISGIIGMSVSYLPWPVYVRQSLATALAIGTMVKMGITHPPAGGAAIMLANGKWSWLTLPFMLTGVCIAICSATFFNNLSQKRQYPTSWGLQRFVDAFTTLFESVGDDKLPPSLRSSHKLALTRKIDEAQSKGETASFGDHDYDGGDKIPEETATVDSDYSKEIEV